MTDAAYQTLDYAVDDRVATLPLARPERHNAFDRTMAGELADAWQRIAGDPDVVSVVVTGTGERAFCTGVDLAAVASGESLDEDEAERSRSPWLRLTGLQNGCWKPVVTAVNGMCCGGGLHFVADSDLVLAAEHASFFDTHVRVGLIAGMEPVSLARRIPLEAVLRLALLGGSERMDAREAHRIGLVGEVLPPAELLPRAQALARAIAAHSPTALRRTKRAIWQGLEVGLEDALDRTWARIREHNAHPDLAEGARAFAEKRPPRWAPGED